MKIRFLAFALALQAIINLSAVTTIDPAAAYAYGANIGWLKAETASGAAIGEFVCSGYLYSANCGWINLGDGTPANGIRYQNNSATDFGVNTQNYTSDGVTFQAKLRGYAYGANIGWINFEATGNPRIDLASGQLLGYAYGANVGWIALSETGLRLHTTTLAAGTDSDNNGIPDAWERLHAGGSLAIMTATTDSDGDGILDKDEYLADTDPFNPADRLRILALVAPRSLPSVGHYATDLTWTSQPTRQYTIETNPDVTSLWTVAADHILPSASNTTQVSFDDPDSSPSPSNAFTGSNPEFLSLRKPMNENLNTA